MSKIYPKEKNPSGLQPNGLKWTSHPRSLSGLYYEHPVVDPQVMHFKHVPFRIMVMLPHSGQESPV